MIEFGLKTTVEDVNYHTVDLGGTCGTQKFVERVIENSLIYYEREEKAGPKSSIVSLFKTEPQTPLKNLLTKALGIKVVVDKKREIYFIDNVKFHIDSVVNLGNFYFGIRMP